MKNPERKIIDYDVLMHDECAGFIELAKEYIAQGWQPFGGLNVPIDELGYPAFYVQAMVKYEN